MHWCVYARARIPPAYKAVLEWEATGEPRRNLLFVLLGPLWRGAIMTTTITVVLALSFVVLTGFGGITSLAQMAFAGIAGFSLSKIAMNTGIPFPWAPILAALIAAAAARAQPPNDTHESCAGWAAFGECTANAEWMLDHCAKSCHNHARGDGEASEDGGAVGSLLDSLSARIDNSWLRELNAEPGHARHAPNRRARELRSGHYVPVKPTPLPDPVLVACSNRARARQGVRRL